MVPDGRMLVQDQDDPADRGRPNKGGPRSSHSRGMGENYTRGCPRLVRALRLQGSQPTDGLGRDRMNAVSLRTESVTAVDQPNSLFKSQTAVTGRKPQCCNCNASCSTHRDNKRALGAGRPRPFTTTRKLLSR